MAQGLAADDRYQKDERACALRKAFFLIREEHHKTYRKVQRVCAAGTSTPSHFLLGQSFSFILNMKIVTLRESLDMGEGELSFPARVEIRRFSKQTLNFAAILSRIVRKSFINKDVTFRMSMQKAN